jgi:Flp pilus assembly protein TadD
MAVGSAIRRGRVATLVLWGVAAAFVALPAPALSQAIPVYNESAGDALARNVKTLADSPKDFNALIGAGKAALRLGDTQAAAGFFGRAEEVNSRSPLPLEGMGAAMVAMGDPNGALNYFTRAQHLGASVASVGSDRGLAYDLLGKQTAAQTDYRAALTGPDRDEARRRLALSLAISGRKSLAMETLQPLLQRHDLGAQRVRVLVLALNGDLAGAKAALDYAMPGASARMDPFFRKLPALTNVQKAAAVHLGIFPESGVAMASADDSSGAAREDRLASIDQLLAQAPEAPAPVPAVVPRQQPQQRTVPIRNASVPAYRIVDTRRVTSTVHDTGPIETKRVAGDPNSRKIWLQLASAQEAGSLAGEFAQIKARKPSLFNGISGYVSDGSRARLLIGPFHSYEDADIFADALANAKIRSTRLTTQPGEVVRKISAR